MVVLALLASAALGYWSVPHSSPAPPAAAIFASGSVRGAVVPSVEPRRPAPATELPASTRSLREQLALWRIPEASLGPLPTVLVGSQVDGGLEVDASGHFRPTEDTIRLFDYFLLALGTEPDDVVLGRIRLQILDRLPATAAGEAMAMLDDYMRMRGRLSELRLLSSGDVEVERERFERIKRLRREELGAAVADVVYGEQERIVEVELERRAVSSDASLDPATRDVRLRELDERLPVRVREQRAASRVVLDTEAEVARLRMQGASDREIFALREQRFGRAAAERLRALDERRGAAARGGS